MPAVAFHFIRSFFRRQTSGKEGTSSGATTGTVAISKNTDSVETANPLRSDGASTAVSATTGTEGPSSGTEGPSTGTTTGTSKQTTSGTSGDGTSGTTAGTTGEGTTTPESGVGTSTGQSGITTNTSGSAKTRGGQAATLTTSASKSVSAVTWDALDGTFIVACFSTTQREDAARGHLCDPTCLGESHPSLSRFQKVESLILSCILKNRVKPKLTDVDAEGGGI